VCRDELHKKVDKSKSESCEMAASLELQKSQNVKVRGQKSGSSHSIFQLYLVQKKNNNSYCT